MEIVKLKGADFGIEETKAQEIAGQFKPMLDKMIELEKEYNKVVKMPREREETAEKAKELRLKLVKVRTGTADIHKAQKAFYLAGGRFVDAWKNAQLFASQGLEDKLLEIETYKQRIELEKQQKRQEDRENQIRPYFSDFEGLNLGAMQEDVWQAYYEKKKRDFEDLERAKADAEKKRLEALRLERVHNEREKILRPYFEFIPNYVDHDFSDLEDSQFEDLFIEVQAKKNEFDRIKELEVVRRQALNPYYQFAEISNDDYLNLGLMEAGKFQMVLEFAQAKSEAYAKKLKEQEAENARLKAEAEAKELERQKELEIERKKRAEIEAKAKAEAEELERKRQEQIRIAEDARKKLEAELKAKNEAEARAEAERKALELKAKKEAEALVKAGDQARLKDWVQGFKISAINGVGLAPVSEKTAEEIADKFLAFKKWALELVEKS